MGAGRANPGYAISPFPFPTKVPFHTEQSLHVGPSSVCNPNQPLWNSLPLEEQLTSVTCPFAGGRTFVKVYLGLTGKLHRIISREWPSKDHQICTRQVSHWSTNFLCPWEKHIHRRWPEQSATLLFSSHRPDHSHRGEKEAPKFSGKRDISLRVSAESFHENWTKSSLLGGPQIFPWYSCPATPNLLVTTATFYHFQLHMFTFSTTYLILIHF